MRRYEMYAQVVRVQLQPNKADQFAGTFRSAVLPLIREREGFQNAYVLVDRDANRGIAVALYDTKEQVDALLSSGFFQEQVAKFEGVFASPPEREVYEIAASS